MKIDASSMEWIRKPKSCQVTKDKVEIITEPHTDLWQRTYYHFRNDNAPALQMKTEDDFCVENSIDGINFKQMRICHMFNAPMEISFGIYACSPEDSSFLATFTDMEITECTWKAHDGQQPDYS